MNINVWTVSPAFCEHVAAKVKDWGPEITVHETRITVRKMTLKWEPWAVEKHAGPILSRLLYALHAEGWELYARIKHENVSKNTHRNDTVCFPLGVNDCDY